MGDRETNADFIEVERRAFLATGNAMHAWAAYSFARVVKAPPPEWVLKYFDRCARGILKVSHDSIEKGGKNPAPKVLDALHLKGSDLTGFHDKWMVYGMNVRNLMGQNDKPDFAIESVAKAMGVSYSTVWRGWKRYDETFPGDAVMPQDAVKE
jgi:hypothetical protein